MIRKSLFSLSLASAVSAVCSFALLVIVARVLEPAEIGAFAVAYAIVLFIEPIPRFQIDAVCPIFA